MHIVRENDEVPRQCRQLVAEIFQSLSAVLPRINVLISRTDLSMSESIIIQAVYIAIGPFFAVEFGADSIIEGRAQAGFQNFGSTDTEAMCTTFTI